MKVYIEYVILNNLAINACLLYWTATVLRRDCKFFRIFFASVIGTIGSVFTPYINGGWYIALKICLPFLMCIFVVKHKNFKSYLASVGVMIGFTATLGGMVQLLFNLGKTDFIMQIDPSSGWLSAILAITCIILTFFIKLVLHRINKTKRKLVYECDVELKLGGKSFQGTGYIDSGNKLYAKAGSPVIFIDSKFLDIDEIGKKKLKTKTVQIYTVNAKSEIDTFKLDEVIVTSGNKVSCYDNIYGSIATNNFNGFSVLLHSDM